MICLFSSCAIHNKFPFVCFRPACVIKQFSMKPLKKRIQIAISSKKKKKNAAKNKKRLKKGSASNNTTTTGNPSENRTFPNDSVVQDSVVNERPSGGSLALMDTVIRIYYLNLTDSTLDTYNQAIKSFVNRMGATHISNVSLTDFYSEEGFTDKSIKSIIEKYLLDNGVSKHKLFWRRNEHVKTSGQQHKPKNLLYLEIRFH